MSLPFATAPELSLHQSVKYVAGAYIVVLAVILIYLTIMAVRAQRLERELERLRADVEAARALSAGEPRGPASGDAGELRGPASGDAGGASASGPRPERESVR